MSENQNIPSLNLAYLEKAEKEICSFYPDRDFCLNRCEPETQTDWNKQIPITYKARRQAWHTHETLTQIREDIIGCLDGSLEKKLREQGAFEEEGEIIEFDPYSFIEAGFEKDGPFGIPEDISQYKELRTMLPRIKENFDERVADNNDFWDNTSDSLQLRTADGKAKPLPKDYFSKEYIEEKKREFEEKEMLQCIEIVHCLDNYNEWYKALNMMILCRRPFTELLQLFKS